MPQLPHFNLRLITPAAAEPLTLDELKKHLRISGSDEDDVIASAGTDARQTIEQWTGRSMLAATYRMTLDRFPLLPNTQYSPGNPSIVTPVVNNVWPLDAAAWAVYLPRAPLISVASIQYVATNQVLTTMDPASYVVDSDSEPPRVAPLAGAFWPSTMWQPSAVQITFTAGYAGKDLVPGGLKRAIKLLAAHFYENREAVTELSLKEAPIAVQSLVTTNGLGFIW